MTNKEISGRLALLLAVTIGVASHAYAGSGYVPRTTVLFDDADREAGGISETYATYDIAYYYDAGADGLLFYTSPTEIVDGDSGEGIDDLYIDFQFGLMYGIRVDYTTNDYRVNKVVCADTIHYFRPVLIPGPGAGSGYDPYKLSEQPFLKEENEIRGYTSDEVSETYSPEEIIVVGETYACIRTPTVSSVMFQAIDTAVTNDNP